MNSIMNGGSEELILRNVRVFCNKLMDEKNHVESDELNAEILGSKINDRQWNSARDVSTVTSHLMSDIMGDLTFSRNWNMIDSESNRWILSTVHKGVACINMVKSVGSRCTKYRLIIHFRSVICRVFSNSNLTRFSSVLC